MNQEGLLLWKKFARQNSLAKMAQPAGRSFAGETIDFDVVTLTLNIAHARSHSGAPERRAPH